MKNLYTLLFLCAAAAAQPDFEAASIKPVEPGPCPVCWRGNGGPGTSDPGRVFRSTNLRGLIVEAYDLQLYQYFGPDWAEGQRFELTATMPRGTTREQYHQMLQRFLTERFHLVVHHETRELPAYRLTVVKGGSKLKSPAPAATDDDPPSADGPSTLDRDADGYPILKNGTSMAIVSGKGKNGDRARAQGRKAPIADLVNLLRGQLNSPVIDATGLEGEFDYTLSWIPTRPGASLSEQVSDAGPDLFQALQQQLGLKLTPGKGPVDCLVLDSGNKMPIEN